MVDHKRFPEVNMDEMDKIFSDMGRVNTYKLAENILPLLSKIVKDLGVEEVILSKESFNSRSPLMWLAVEELEDPNHYDYLGDEERNEMKDEWFD